jgi:hypothetical protein
MYRGKMMGLQDILDKAEQYEKEGKKELAKKFFAMAEKYEEVMKRNKETVRKQKSRGI